MSDEMERIEALVDLMRRKGIRTLSSGGTRIEIGDAPVAAALPGAVQTVPHGASVTPPPAMEDAPFMMPDTRLCRCGHAMVDHDESGCLVAGCSVNVCAETKV